MRGTVRYRMHTLKNGLRAVLIPLAGTKTATVMVMAGTGSRYETEKENGLAHFLEHMFFKGTAKRPSARAISEELDSVGASYNAFTAKERTAYYAKVSSQYFDTALDVISDIFLNSTLPSREITKERGAIVQEIGMYEDMPMRKINDVFDELFFGSDHPLGRPIIGTRENVLRFTRAQFESYMRGHYTPQNTVVCVAGSFDEARVLRNIARNFGRLKKREPHLHAASDPTPPAGPRVRIKEKHTDQTQLMLGVPAYPYGHTDEYALEVLSAILGSGMSSRLFLEVRERRGLAYFVRGWTDKYPDVGYFVVQAGVEHAKLEKAVQTILGELRKIKRTDVPHSELKKVKAHMRGTLTLSLETTDAVAEHAATSLIHFGRVRPLSEILAGIDAVTVSDVRRVAKDVFHTGALNLAVIGPHTGTSAVALKGLLRL